MNSTTSVPAIREPAANMALQSRLRVLRSNAFALLGNRVEEDEVREAITPALLAELPVALESVLEEMAPPDLEVLAIEIGRMVGIIGQNWRQAGRDEFVHLVTQELADLPGALVLDALSRARKRVTDGRLLLAWVCDDVEPKAEKLKLERDKLTKLVELALPES
jgi:hypothetical protein